MPQFSTVHRVEHRPQDMFALVADIEKYPEFVPLCQALTTRSEREKAGRKILVADMTVGYKAIRETFTCQVVLDPETQKIAASYIDGPFKHLDNRWHFEETEDGACNVHFSIDYEFKNRALAMLMGSMFDRAFRLFTKAFEERADALYGRGENLPNRASA